MTKSSCVVLDFEVQNVPYYGSVASPHCPDNYIVAIGWSVDNGAVKSRYYESAEDSIKSHEFIQDLLNTKVLVAFNATFEIHWLMKVYRDEFLQFLKEGGKVYDPQYAEFLLTNQTEMYPSLEDCSIKYGGTKKIDAVKILWEQGTLTGDIDPTLLMEYLAGKGGDIENTRRVVFAQVPLLKEHGMYDMFMIRMDSLLFNAISTYNGLYVDTEVAEVQLKEQQGIISGLLDTVKGYLPADLPADFEFSMSSPYHMSALLFGGAVKYKTKVSYEPKKYEQIEAYKIEQHTEHGSYYVPTNEFDPDCAFNTQHVERYKAGKNKGLPKLFKIDSDVEKLKWGEDVYTFKGLIDLEALPQHVQEQFTGKRAEFMGKRLLSCGTPVYSTGKDSLDVLANFTDIAKPLKELAAQTKDVTTYYRSEVKGKVSGMLQFVEPNGIIHHQLNNCSTITGRLSGSKPNMQNIPREGTSRVKNMFRSRFEGGRIVEVDYTALEVVALATISGDKNLTEQLISGTDMHCYRLAGALGEDYESVLKKCKDASHPDHAVYVEMRQQTKPKAFANQYGASAMGISLSTGCTLEEAEKFKETERNLFPEASTFAERIVRPEVEQTGSASFERELNAAGAWTVFRRGYFTAKGGTRYSFRQYEKYVKGQTVMDYKDTQLANYWCQGEASFIVQAACGRVIRKLLQNDFYGGTIIPINTVHDCIQLDTSDPSAGKYGAEIVKEIMESTPKWLCEQIPAYKDWGYDVTPFPAAAEMGVSSAELSTI